MVGTSFFTDNKGAFSICTTRTEREEFVADVAKAVVALSVSESEVTKVGTVQNIIKLTMAMNTYWDSVSNYGSGDMLIRAVGAVLPADARQLYVAHD